MNILIRVLPYISIAALVAIFALASALLGQNVERATANQGMLAATIIWFATAPFWIGRSKAD